MPYRVESPAKLLDALAARLPGWKRGTLRERLRDGLVLVNGVVETRASTPLSEGDVVELVDERTVKADRGAPFPVLYEDADVIAIDKPEGLLTVAGGGEFGETAFRRLNEWMAARAGVSAAERGRARRGGEWTEDALPVHRLDRETSGVLLFAKMATAKDALVRSWDRAEKTYLAVTERPPDAPEGEIRLRLREDKGLFVRVSRGGKAAVTRYRVMATAAGRALLEVRIETGVKHQIRVHLASMGCPVLGDLRYGQERAERLFLHAWRLAFPHPGDGRMVTVEASPPRLFGRFLPTRHSRESGNPS